MLAEEPVVVEGRRCLHPPTQHDFTYEPHGNSYPATHFRWTLEHAPAVAPILAITL